jgi:putative tricarboxylic transport membrane protein
MKASKDTAFGVLGIVIAGLYWLAAGEIQQSFLSDEIGADGVPKLLAFALAALSALVTLRSLRLRTVIAETVDWQPHAKAFGLLVIGILYVALLPQIGYLVATAALIAAAALYAGQPFSRSLPVIAIGGSVFLWVVFAKLFAISLPAGLWTRL